MDNRIICWLSLSYTSLQDETTYKALIINRTIYPQVIHTEVNVPIVSVHLCIMVKIYDTDTIREIAKKIYNDFEVCASCTVIGFVMNESTGSLIPKGEAVVANIESMDSVENCRYVGDKKIRNYKFRKGSVGGPIVQKIFTWDKKIVDEEPRVTIWRFQ